MKRRDSDFGEFFAATWHRVYRSTYAVAGDHQRTEDALQTAYTKAYANWRQVSTADNPQAYVARMAINAAISAHRKASARHERTFSDLSRFVDATSGSMVERVDPEVWDAVRNLPPRQRAVLVLRYREGLSEREIADVLRCRPGTVKSHASAALAALRQDLGQAENRAEPDDSQPDDSLSSSRRGCEA